MMNFFKERRASKRFNAELDTEFKILGDDTDLMELRYRKAKTKNISFGGLCMATKLRVESGSVVRIDLPLEDRLKAINTFCEVEWCRPESGSYLAGLSFIGLGDEETEHLKQYIEQYN